MGDYSYCLGITLDGNYAEKICKKRENCQYYLHDLFKRFPRALGEGDMILNEPGAPCKSFLPKQEIVEIERDEDPFAPIVE